LRDSRDQRNLYFETPMKHSIRDFTLTWTIISISALAYSTATAGETLSQRIEGIIDAPEFKHAHWGILVGELESDRTLYERNADKLFAPASTTKLFTVAAALEELGANYRFETPIYARGEVDQGGRLRGDLILVASGDLSMGGRTDSQGHIAFKDNDHIYAGFAGRADLTVENPLAGLDELARQVAAAGIRRVNGSVLIDDRLFETASGTGSGPSLLTPIMINDNLLDITITPGDAGAPATVRWRPETAAYQLDAQVDTAAAGEASAIHVTSPDGKRIIVRGKIAAGAKPMVRIYEVSDPASFARSLLIEALRRAGVHVEASPLVDNDRGSLPPRERYTALKQVALLKSPPFSESAKLILKVSHNLDASTLPLIVAAKHDQRTLAAGLRRQHDLLAKLGVDVDSISFGGGAGGDRADYVTPRAAVQLLRKMAARPDFPVYRTALPVLGVDGTLAHAVEPDSPARGKVHAKTGTLVWSNVMNGTNILNSKALAGYSDESGAKGRLVFAMFVNQVQIARSDDRERIGRVLGKLCEAVCAE
jgi:serine-type D-Ala-D-Ala carboxypeptidase/endopeptidase (penicillin-binding protein 4)